MEKMFNLDVRTYSQPQPPRREKGHPTPRDAVDFATKRGSFILFLGEGKGISVLSQASSILDHDLSFDVELTNTSTTGQNVINKVSNIYLWSCVEEADFDHVGHILHVHL